MTISTFDLTEHTQLAVRYDTGFHPMMLSLGITTVTNRERFKQKLPDMCSYDAVEWERAVKMAKWILKIDEEYHGRD